MKLFGENTVMHIDEHDRKIYAWMEGLLALYETFGTEWFSTTEGVEAMRGRMVDSKSNAKKPYIFVLKKKRMLKDSWWQVAQPNARGSEKLATYYKLTPIAYVALAKYFDIEIPKECKREAAKLILNEG